MSFKAEIPYGAYWSTPFARWQGAFANLHSVEFAAHVVARELQRRHIDPKAIDYGALGFSVPQKHSFYGLPWLLGRAGAGQVAGPTLMQACATGVRVLLATAQEVEAGMAEVAIGITCDRTSNGPHLYYPNPAAPGGTGLSAASDAASEKRMPSSAASVDAVFLKLAEGTSKGSVMKRRRKAASSASAVRYCASRCSTTSCCSAVAMPSSRATCSAVTSIECGPSGSQLKLSITQSSCVPLPPGAAGLG